VRDVFIRRCTFRSNAGVGLYVHKAGGDAVSNVTLEDNLVQGNDQGLIAAGVDGVAVVNNYVWGHRGRAKSGIAVGATTTRTVISGNYLWDNFRGIISIGTAGADIRANIVVGTGPIPGLGQGEDGDGIVCRGQDTPIPNACVVSANIVRKCAGAGIVALLVSNVRVVGNVVEDTGQAGLSLAHTSGSEARGNTISRIGQEAPREYDVVEVKQSSNDNLIVANVLRLGASARNAIGIGADCENNQVIENVVVR
jgi:parallel beta-helix repeat protein